jgi:hypothetical protein
MQSFHKAQLTHYLQATDLEVGLLLNFGNRPTFARVVYRNARKRHRHEVPRLVAVEGSEPPEVIPPASPNPSESLKSAPSSPYPRDP